jgi:hypothetical protein
MDKYGVPVLWVSWQSAQGYVVTIYPFTQADVDIPPRLIDQKTVRLHQ